MAAKQRTEKVYYSIIDDVASLTLSKLLQKETDLAYLTTLKESKGTLRKADWLVSI